MTMGALNLIGMHALPCLQINTLSRTGAHLRAYEPWGQKRQGNAQGTWAENDDDAGIADSIYVSMRNATTLLAGMPSRWPRLH